MAIVSSSSSSQLFTGSRLPLARNNSKGSMGDPVSSMCMGLDAIKGKGFYQRLKLRAVDSLFH